jgi:hypothetical protein
MRNFIPDQKEYGQTNGEEWKSDIFHGGRTKRV